MAMGRFEAYKSRRSDTPGFIFNAHNEMINVLKPATNSTELYQRIP
jgi:hypothetical protein